MEPLYVKAECKTSKQFKYLNLNIYSIKVKKYVLQIWILSFIYPFFYVTLKLIVGSY